MSEPLFKIHNRHIPECQDPPIINNDDPQIYVGYFENELGEQWIFTFDPRTQKGELRGGDVGWNERYAVVNGCAPGLILAPEEFAWLRACWMAATGAR